MITTDAPAWLRRSDQAVHGPAPCSPPAAPSSSTARQQICRAALLGNDGYQNLRNSTRTKLLR